MRASQLQRISLPMMQRFFSRAVGTMTRRIVSKAVSSFHRRIFGIFVNSSVQQYYNSLDLNLSSFFPPVSFLPAGSQHRQTPPLRPAGLQILRPAFVVGSFPLPRHFETYPFHCRLSFPGRAPCGILHLRDYSGLGFLP